MYKYMYKYKYMYQYMYQLHMWFASYLYKCILFLLHIHI